MYSMFSVCMFADKSVPESRFYERKISIYLLRIFIMKYLKIETKNILFQTNMLD